MTAPTLEPTLAAAVVADAYGIAHALHQGHLTDLGLRSDTVVVAEIAWSVHEAQRLHTPLAALAAADYDDNAQAYCRCYRAALWRSCQLHEAEWLYPSLTGTDRAGLLTAADKLAEALLAETMGED